MADKIVSQDPTKPGVLKVNGPTLSATNQLPLNGIDPTGAVNGDVIVRVGGVWTAGAGGSSSDTASNLGAGAQVFKSKVAGDFQFRTLVAGTNISIATNANDLTINNTASAGVFTSSFSSAQQVITAAGALTLAHGLGGIPLLFQIHLVNTIADAGYSPGDLLPIQSHLGGQSNQGVSVVPDATNLNIRFSSAAQSFNVLNKGSGVGTDIVNANWQIVFRAWR